VFRDTHKQEVKKLKDEILDSVPKDQKKDAYRQLKEEKDIQQAERVRYYIIWFYYARKQLLLSARLSHRNFVRPSVRPSVCHTGGSVKNSAS